MRITQAWESLAKEWIGDKKELTEDLVELKTELKKTLKSWRIKYPNADKSGFLGTRVTDALNWDKAIAKTIRLAAMFKIDLDVLDLARVS